jgi:cold shock protein
MPTGTVLWFSLMRGFCFIQPDDGKDVFVHINEVRNSGFVRLRVETLITRLVSTRQPPM